MALEIAVNAQGNAFVTGLTTSPDFPPAPAAPKLVPGGGFDAFVVKLSAAGDQLVYSTYLGGSDDENFHGGIPYGGIAIDAHDNAYVTGLTKSANFPVFPNIDPNPKAYQTKFNGGVGDGYVARLNAAGNALFYSTYLGGPGFDGNHGIAADSFDQAYVTGSDGSGTIPANGLQATHSAGCKNGNADGFVAKLNTSGTGLLYYTYLGGNWCNLGWGIAVYAAQKAYVTGETWSTTFPTTLGALDTTCGRDGEMQP
jgi:Beta-propeller repeat